jgi:hypothetical protein
VKLAVFDDIAEALPISVRYYFILVSVNNASWALIIYGGFVNRQIKRCADIVGT